jgi:hypothetical protein
MPSIKNQSQSLLTNYILVILIIVILYYTISMLSKRRTNCGCMGQNASCPCNRLRFNKLRNEYYQPQIGSDFTTYLDQVRRNQLQFSKN